MKTLLFLIAALICFNTTGFSELNVADLEKIQRMNTETEARLEKRISAEIKAQSAEIRALSTEIKAQGELFSAELKVLSTEIRALSKRLDFHGQLMIALILAILAFVATPSGIILYLLIRRSREQDEKIEVSRQEQAAENQRLREKITELESRQAFRA